MSDVAIRVAFPETGPARADELGASLADWLTDTVGRDSECGCAINVERQQGNAAAQGGLNEMMITAVTEGAVAGVIVASVHLTAERAFKVIMRRILEWWVRSGKPALSFKTSNADPVVITDSTAEPQREVERVLSA